VRSVCVVTVAVIVNRLAGAASGASVMVVIGLSLRVVVTGDTM
jgi:hypothetical protein